MDQGQTEQQPQPSIPTPEKPTFGFRQEYFHTFQDGKFVTAGAEFLLSLPPGSDVRAFINEGGIQKKGEILAAGITAATQMARANPDQIFSVNVDPDFINHPEGAAFIYNPDIPSNLIFEVTEIAKLDEEAAEKFIDKALKNRRVLIDDMPTDESLHNMRVLFSKIKEQNIQFGVKVDFKTTKKLLLNPVEGDANYDAAMNEKKQAEQEITQIRKLLEELGLDPHWIVFEGLTSIADFQKVIDTYGSVIDPRAESERAQIFGQFYQNTITDLPQQL